MQDVEDVIRTLKSAIDRKTGTRLKANDAIMTWMVEHAGMIINRCRIGIDGLTAYERLKGKLNKKKFMEFGE